MSTVVYLIYVYEELGFTPSVLGIVFAAGGVASLAGAVAAERVSPWLGPGASMIVGVAGFSLATLLLPLAPGSGRLMGRVAGAGGVAAAGAMLLGGVLGESLGLRATLWAAGAAGLLGAVVLALSPVRRLRALPAGA